MRSALSMLSGSEGLFLFITKKGRFFLLRENINDIYNSYLINPMSLKVTYRNNYQFIQLLYHSLNVMQPVSQRANSFLTVIMSRETLFQLLQLAALIILGWEMKHGRLIVNYHD